MKNIQNTFSLNRLHLSVMKRMYAECVRRCHTSSIFAVFANSWDIPALMYRLESKCYLNLDKLQQSCMKHMLKHRMTLARRASSAWHFPFAFISPFRCTLCNMIKTGVHVAREKIITNHSADRLTSNDFPLLFFLFSFLLNSLITCDAVEAKL